MAINLKDFEYRWWSQHGEDGVLEKLFDVIPPRNKQFVEIGAHFHEANCIRLQQHAKWKGFYFDDFHEFPPLGFYKMWVTRENINPLMTKVADEGGISRELDILSIDIDGMDFYLWNALDREWKPSLVIVECTTQLGLEDKVVQYDPEFRWDGSVYAGASPQAWLNLGNHRGYSLVHIESSGVNMFFVRNDLIQPDTFQFTNNLEALLDQTNKECNYKPDVKQRAFVRSTDIIL
jgi:hypothetical protein